MTRWTTPLEEPNTLYNSINATELDSNDIILDHGTILEEKSEMPSKKWRNVLIDGQSAVPI